MGASGRRVVLSVTRRAGRRTVARSFRLLVTLTLAARCSTPDVPPDRAAEAPSGRPRNVILISIDAARPDHLGCYGYRRNTSPNIDALCRAGWVFEQAYCATPRTGPSVASLLTGVFPPDATEWKVRAGIKTLAETLSARGYATTAAIDNGNLSRKSGYDQGFEIYRETWLEADNEIRQADLITTTAIDQLHRFEREQRPFFLWLHYVNPHSPYAPPQELSAPFLDDAIWKGNTTRLRVGSIRNGIRPDVYVEGQHRVAYYIAQYDGEIALADAHVGKVLAALKTLPFFRDTLIIITADHGEALGEEGIYFKHGPPLTEAHVRIPLIMYQPGAAVPPRRVDRPVAIIDIVPTVLDFLDVRADDTGPVPEESPTLGESLRPLIEGRASTPTSSLFMASRDYWAVRAGDQKLIVQTRAKSEFPSPPLQLYDLASDPHELRNLVGEQPDAVDRLRKIIEERRATEDQIWSR